MPVFRVLLVGGLLNGLLNILLVDAFGLSRVAVPFGTALWLAIGYFRVFGTKLGAASYKQACQGVLMSLAWPLLPRKE